MGPNIANNTGSVVFNPTAGSEFEYQYDDSSEILQTIGKAGNKIKTTVRSKIIFLYKIRQRSGEGFVVSVNFISGNIENISNASEIGGPLEKDSTHFQKGINALKGLTFDLKLDLNGRIRSLSGYKEYLDKSSRSTEKPFSEAFFSEIFEKISESFSDHKINADSSWKLQGFERNGIEFFDINYVCDSIDQGLAHIHSFSKVKQRVSALNNSLLMEGKEYGQIEIDLTTGMILNNFTKMELGGVCNIGGMDVSQSMANTSSLAGKKISD